MYLVTENWIFCGEMGVNEHLFMSHAAAKDYLDKAVARIKITDPLFKTHSIEDLDIIKSADYFSAAPFGCWMENHVELILRPISFSD